LRTTSIVDCANVCHVWNPLGLKNSTSI
jgi:hypothetical protein